MIAGTLLAQAAALPLEDLVGAWVAVGLTLFMFSFLYEDNAFYKFGEHLYVGVSVGYGISQAIWLNLIPKWWDPLFHAPYDLTLLIPGIMGLLFLTYLVPKVAWLSRWPMATIMGYGAGLAIPLTVTSLIFKQAEGTVKPLLRMTAGATPGVDTSNAALWADFSTLLVLVGVLSVLVYFFFSIEHKGPVKAVSKIGILFLMVYFGASYGNTVQGRFALLYGRFADLTAYAKADYGYASYVLSGLLVLVLAVLRLRRREA